MTTGSIRDRWATWLLETRFAGDPTRKNVYESFLFPVRDRVLANARVGEGDVLLDVGAGDGLIAFGALPLVGDDGKIIVSDISRDLLDHTREITRQLDVLDRVEFVLAPADDLSAIPDSSVDIVTTRSVLIYVERKQHAFREFYRVLKPGGRVSIFEPINRFSHPEPPGTYLGIDVRPVEEIAAKVRAHYERLQPVESDPMLDFDEHDLFAQVEEAGFEEIHLAYEASLQPRTSMRWEHFFRSSGNPKIPTLEVAVSEELPPDEAQFFVDYIRPRVEAGEGVHRAAVVYLWATKHLPR